MAESPDLGELYRNSNDSELSITNIFGKENLEIIQQKISKATGLAFVTVDYRGEPVTELTSFTSFCQIVRKEKESEKLCMASDAFGAIQAAVTQKPYVYFCPCGLFEVAIPIIIKGQYLGGFIGGQLRCFDAPEGTSDLRAILRHQVDYKNQEGAKDLYESVSTISYRQFIDFAELIHLIIMQLGEKEMSKLSEKKNLNYKIDVLNEQRKRVEIENSLKNAELAALKAKANPQFLLRSLNSISNLAVIENAPRTNEATRLIAEFFKQNLTKTENMVPINKEFDNIERYLKIQKIRLGDLLTYSINIDEKAGDVKIPCLTVLPFVEKAVFYGASRRMQGGLVNISVKDSPKYVTIIIEDNGPVLNDDTASKDYKNFGGIHEDESIEAGMFTARQIMISYFGIEYDIEIQKDESRGTRSILKYPKNFEERIV